LQTACNSQFRYRRNSQRSGGCALRKHSTALAAAGTLTAHARLTIATSSVISTRSLHDKTPQLDTCTAVAHAAQQPTRLACACDPTCLFWRPPVHVVHAAQQPTRHAAVTVSLNLNERRHSSTKQLGPQVRSNAASHQASSLGCEQCMCKKAAPGLLAACTRPWDLGGPMIGCSGSPPLGSRCPLNRHVRTPWAPYRRLQKDAPSKRGSEA
jgi:hypothetical protein